MMEGYGKQGDATPIEVVGLSIGNRDQTVLRDLSFLVGRSEIFAIIGASGCGKTTLMRHMVGLQQPSSGRVLYNGRDLVHASSGQRREILRKCGVLYQQGALWSSMTVLENVALPIEQHTARTPREVYEIASLKLALVGLRDFRDYYPSELSGGMRKRAALARAIALDPEFLFLDEPSTGLDPVLSRTLDDLILRLRDGLGCTVVMITHDLASIFAVADRALFIDAATRTIGGLGTPEDLRGNPPSEAVREFVRGRIGE